MDHLETSMMLTSTYRRIPVFFQLFPDVLNKMVTDTCNNIVSGDNKAIYFQCFDLPNAFTLYNITMLGQKVRQPNSGVIF